ncbi:MAG TPA: MerR family DNA-binding protein [Burkholderiaceae bacterium]
MGTGLTIGRLAKAAGVGIETVRYYQRLGLLPAGAPLQQGQAFRHYPIDAVERIRFVKRAQGLGFSLDEISQLLQLNDGADRTRVRELARSRLDNVREKILDLQRMEGALAHLLHECEHSGAAQACPIIEAFKGPD